MKYCNKCKSDLPFSEFNKSSKTKDGYIIYCKNCENQRKKEYYKKNCILLREKKNEYHRKINRKYQKANWDLQKHKDRINKDPVYYLAYNLRRRISIAFKRQGYSKKTKTKEILGVEYDIARKHIESKFKDGMSWDNYGKWHIDHIIPLSLATSQRELIELCYFTNLQPLWALDNISKSNKII